MWFRVRAWYASSRDFRYWVVWAAKSGVGVGSGLRLEASEASSRVFRDWVVEVGRSGVGFGFGLRFGFGLALGQS